MLIERKDVCFKNGLNLDGSLFVLQETNSVFNETKQVVVKSKKKCTFIPTNSNNLEEDDPLREYKLEKDFENIILL